MGTSMQREVGKGGVAIGRHRLCRALPLLLAASAACSDGRDATRLLLPEPPPGEPLPGEPHPADGALEVPAFLGLPLTEADSDSSPPLLSQTGAFVDLERLDAAPGILPYSVQSPLWSDGAQKRRWMALPSGGHIGFSEEGAWSFPEGTVFIKQFGMVLDERTPDVVRRLETRFLVAAQGGDVYGLVYKWDDDQRDARLLLDGGEDVLDIVGADGSVRQQRYTYPSPRACGACHSERSGFFMGARTAQLNGEYHASAGEPSADEAGENQLEAWAALDMFDTQFTDAEPAAHERLAPLADAAAPLEARVRSYWDSNCSSCHNAASPFPSWDARFSTPLEEQGVLLAAPHSGGAPDGVRLIVPGDPEHSLIYLRSQSDQPGTRMPPLLRNRVDDRYVELLREWIESLPAP
ncbi:MAG TPA: hypothetical protein VMG12_16400 [Polyangiaceae bacterium]|nr:hypothetical protein [Polyangiaceae bacterium]